MRKSIFYFLSLTLIAFKVQAQMPVTDVAANAQLNMMNTNMNRQDMTLSNIQQALGNIQREQSKLTNQVASNQLKEAEKTGNTLKSQYEMLEKVYSVASSTLQGYQQVQTFFRSQQDVLSRIQRIRSFMVDPDVIRVAPQAITNARNLLNTATQGITQSTSIANGAFSQSKMTVSERMSFIKDAAETLSKVNTQVTQAETTLQGAQKTAEKHKESKKLIKTLF